MEEISAEKALGVFEEAVEYSLEISPILQRAIEKNDVGLVAVILALLASKIARGLESDEYKQRKFLMSIHKLTMRLYKNGV